MDLDILKKLLRDLGKKYLTLEAALSEIRSSGDVTVNLVRDAVVADAAELNNFLHENRLLTNQAAADFFGVRSRTISRWRNPSTQASSPEGIPVEASRQILGIAEDDWRAILKLCLGDLPSAPSDKDAPAVDGGQKFSPPHRGASGDLMKGEKGQNMTASVALDQAQEALNARRQKVWDDPNGIQFVMHAIHNKRWEPPQRTDFKVVDEKHKRTISDDEGEAIRNYLIKLGLDIFEDAKKKEALQEDSGYSICNEVPPRFGRLIYWRWRFEPRESFVFLAGGVGSEKKQVDWANHSQMQLRPDEPNGLMEALAAYADAYRACYG
ncbi:MAG: hypothetical protein ACLPX9_12465 [Rhodomicrobium sp.]